MINIPLDVDVECTDGLAGISSSVIVNRKTLQATHFVAKEKERPQTERLVPIEYVQESAADRIRLNCTINELQEMQEFVTTSYRQVEIIRYSASNYGCGLHPFRIRGAGQRWKSRPDGQSVRRP